jgi:hypothetical protein
VDLLDQNGNVIAKQDHPSQAGYQTDFEFQAKGVFGVRVQLNGQNYLSLAEVEVFGSVDGTPSESDPLGGWHILSPDYDEGNLLDIVSFEWDYFMIHDADAGFYGIIGYLVSNPRARLSKTVKALPNGGSVAMIGQIHGSEPMSQYVNFGLDNYSASATERYFDAEDDAERFGTLTPLPGGGPNGQDALHLEGRNDLFQWDLIVSQDWANRPAPGPRAMVGTDVGYLPDEIWTVDVVWPRTHVKGTVVSLKTGETFNIDNHGYREIAWGRYVVSVDGWDFYVFSEDSHDLAAKGIAPDQGVQYVLQTYLKSELLDWADISFYRDGQMENMRFYANDGGLGWEHLNWKWDNDAWQCVPQDLEVVMQNDKYYIEIEMTHGMQDQHPLLSNATLPVAVYFIQDMFPQYTGKITDRKTGQVIREFRGKGVAEFSFHKSARSLPASTFACDLWSRSIFFHDMDLSSR